MFRRWTALRGVAEMLAVVALARAVASCRLERRLWGRPFFVLSGYLITSLLLAEWHSTDRLRLFGFYGRHARRLLPALVVFMAALAVVGLLAIGRERLRHGRSSLVTQRAAST